MGADDIGEAYMKWHRLHTARFTTGNLLVGKQVAVSILIIKVQYRSGWGYQWLYWTRATQHETWWCTLNMSSPLPPAWERIITPTPHIDSHTDTVFHIPIHSTRLLSIVAASTEPAFKGTFWVNYKSPELCRGYVAMEVLLMSLFIWANIDSGVSCQELSPMDVPGYCSSDIIIPSFSAKKLKSPAFTYYLYQR